MKTTDRSPLIAIAMLAARADGTTDSAEQRAVDSVVAGIGSPDVTRLAEQVASGRLRVADLASRLSDDETRRVAYEGALAICNADGVTNASERAFLEELREALGLSPDEVAEAGRTAEGLAGAPVAGVHAGAPAAERRRPARAVRALPAGGADDLPEGGAADPRAGGHSEPTERPRRPAGEPMRSAACGRAGAPEAAARRRRL